MKRLYTKVSPSKGGVLDKQGQRQRETARRALAGEVKSRKGCVNRHVEEAAETYTQAVGLPEVGVGPHREGPP